MLTTGIVNLQTLGSFIYRQHLYTGHCGVMDEVLTKYESIML